MLSSLTGPCKRSVISDKGSQIFLYEANLESLLRLVLNDLNNSAISLEVLQKKGFPVLSPTLLSSFHTVISNYKTILLLA